MTDYRGSANGPTQDSILFDMDYTIFDLDRVLVDRVRAFRPGYAKADEMPLTNFFIKHFGPVAGSSCLECVYEPRLFADEHIYPNVKKLVLLLVDRGFDVWFVTAPIGAYHYRTCLNEKVAQIRRHFGSVLAEKIILRPDKNAVPGYYLIDDNSHLHTEGASWKWVVFDQDYNKGVSCERRIDRHNCVHQFEVMLSKDRSTVIKLE